MPFAYQRGRKWWIAYKNVAGRWCRKSVTAAGKREAEALAYELERKAERQRMGLDDGPPEGGDLTVHALMTWYLETYSEGTPSHATNKSAIERHILPSWVAKLTVHEASPGCFEEFLQEKSKELAPQTVNHLRGYFSRAFNKARKVGKVTMANPISQVEKRKVPRRAADYLKFEEVPRVLAALSDHWRPLFAAAVYAGLRKGELLALRKSDVDLTGRTLMVARSHDRDTTKGGKAVSVPINAELVPYLKTAAEASKSELLFPGKAGARMRKDVALQDVLHRAMGKAGIVRHYQHACRKRGCGHRETAMDAGLRACPDCHRQLWVKAVVRPLRFHDMRHSAATLMLQQGADLIAVSKILRHSDPKLTAEVYGHLADGYLLKQADKLSFGPAVPAEAEVTAVVAVAAGAGEPARTSVAQLGVVDTKKAGNPWTNPEGLPAFRLERETGFEPATLSLGS